MLIKKLNHVAIRIVDDKIFFTRFVICPYLGHWNRQKRKMFEQPVDVVGFEKYFEMSLHLRARSFTG